VADHDQDHQPGPPGEPLPTGEPAPAERPLAGHQPPFGPRTSLQAGPLPPAGFAPAGRQDAGLCEYGPPGPDFPAPEDYGPRGPDLLPPAEYGPPGPDLLAHEDYGPTASGDPGSGDYGLPGRDDLVPGGYGTAGARDLPAGDYGPPGPFNPAPGGFGPPETSEAWLTDYHHSASDPQLAGYRPPSKRDLGPDHHLRGSEDIAVRGYGPPDSAVRSPAWSADRYRPGSLPQGPAAWPGMPVAAATDQFLLPSREQEPSPGWRRVLYRGTGGLVRLPTSGADLRRQDMISRARTPVHGGHHRVGVISLKGGVGKTTTTICLGSTLAALRGDRIIAVDASPDRGTLCDKASLDAAATVRDLLAERDQIRRYADVRGYTAVTPDRLEVLASDRDPASSDAFSAADYAALCEVLERFYSICLADCGTGLLHSAVSGVLRLADQLILVTSPTVEGARSASAALDWLTAHASRDLVGRAVVVLSGTRPRRRSRIDVSQLEEHFGARCLAVVTVPHDPHLAEGADIDPGLLRRETADAFLALAALIGDGVGRGAPERPGRAR
jgi:MinD-like ATPase involved in chromosome partitioning or flagellar assembly